jgi:hypothetical protein
VFDGEAFGQQMVEIVRGYVDAELAPLIERNAALEARIVELEVQLPVAAPLTVDEVRAIVGEHGPEIVNLTERVAELESREPASPVKGEPGTPGEPGKDGADVDMAEVAIRIEAAVKSAVEALPAPKDGEPGKDGTGLADVLRDAEGNLVVVMTDGRTKSLGKIDGEPGKDGTDGTDGITPTFIDAEFVGRTLRLTFDGGRTCEFQMATPEYVGVFKEAEAYERGDMVTWAGSTWHCDEPKGLKPGAPDSGWTLAVKAGRPGKDK